MNDTNENKLDMVEQARRDVPTPDFREIVSTGYKAVCPVCDREESVENGAIGQAWLIGHIQEEHADELPAFEGCENK